MGGYIKLDKDLAEDPRVAYLTDLTLCAWGIPEDQFELWRERACNAVLGSLYRLWRYADTHLQQRDSVKAALQALGRVTGLSVTELRNFPPEWLLEHPDGRVELPGYTAKNALIDKENRREKTRARVAAWREKQRLKVAPDRNAEVTTASVTRALPPGPVPGPGPRPPRPGPRPEPEAGAEALARVPAAPLALQSKNGAHTPPANLRDGAPRFPRSPATPPSKPTQDELATRARYLAEHGSAPGDITHLLEQYDVTLDQVMDWIKTAPAEHHP